MEIKSKNGLLYIVEIDHLSGECIGQAIEKFYVAKASNVQVVSALTKKNRPSYTFLIDTKPEYADEMENLIIRELSAGGWHRVETTHRFIANEVTYTPITLICRGKKISFSAQGKAFDGGNIRPESNCVDEMRKKILEVFGEAVSYSTAYNILTAAVNKNASEFYINPQNR